MRLLGLLLLLAFVVPFGADVVFRAGEQPATEAAEHQERAPCTGCDDGDDDCSPVCPNCVFAFGARLVPPETPPAVMVPSTPLPAAPEPVAVFHDVTGPPLEPGLSGVFHPPRD